MKDKRAEECLGKIEENSAWRKKELSSMNLMIQDAHQAPDKKYQRTPIIRAGLLLLYAHWEGFVFFAANTYIDHINEYKKYIDHSQARISEHYQWLLTWQHTKNKSNSFHRNSAPIFLEYMRNQRAQAGADLLKFPKKNLKIKVFRDLLQCIDIPFNDFEIYSQAIEKLIDMRNKIAHGEREEPTRVDYYDIEEHTVKLIDIFKTKLQDCVQDSTFITKLDPESPAI